MPKGLYPSVAISDAFVAAGHYVAAFLVFSAGQPLAAWGFLMVAIAATVGYETFFDEKMTDDLNCTFNCIETIFIIIFCSVHA